MDSVIKSAISTTKRCLVEEDALPCSEGVTYHLIPSLEEARRILGPGSDALRRSRSIVYFRGMQDKSRTKLRIGMHDRGEEYVWADGTIHEEDVDGHRHHLPLHLKLIQYESLHIPAGTTLDFSHRHTEWDNISQREELYVLVRIKKLTVEAGAAIEVHGNVFVLQVQEIQMLPQVVDVSTFDIRILPVPYFSYSRYRRGSSIDGLPGANGRHSVHSQAAECVGTLFGPGMIGDEINPDGVPGENGEPGQAGTNGMNGGMCMLADLGFHHIEGFPPKTLRIFSQAGKGQAGGNGGRGGHGGNGGNGAPGFAHGINKSMRGLGGHGGKGGEGGNGGRGGNGGLASNIFITLPEQSAECLNLCAVDSLGGKSGSGGPGGVGGDGGHHGSWIDAGNIVETAPRGVDGCAGQAGSTGKCRPAPQMYVFHL